MTGAGRGTLQGTQGLAEHSNRLNGRKPRFRHSSGQQASAGLLRRVVTQAARRELLLTSSSLVLAANACVPGARQLMHTHMTFGTNLSTGKLQGLKYSFTCP